MRRGAVGACHHPAGGGQRVVSLATDVGSPGTTVGLVGRRTVCDVANTEPWECTMDLARQVWDKSRHVEIFLKLLERIEGYSGVYPETTAETASAGLTDDTLAQIVELAQKIGDADIERALDFVLADTATQVRKDQAYATA